MAELVVVVPGPLTLVQDAGRPGYAADDRPVLFGPDHPTTGGYPVVGVLTDGSFDLLAQLRPGQRVRFRPVAKWRTIAPSAAPWRSSPIEVQASKI
jgi:allophanate hydrolase subunit 2